MPAVQKPEETLYVYWQADSEIADWRVSLGPDQPFAPPVPTWREHLRSLGHPLGTDDEIERACRKYDLPVDDLDTRLNGFGWEDRWDNFAGPQAKAFHLLKGLDLGHSGSALRQAGQIIFEEFGGYPGNSYTWVELHDDLTVSLLAGASHRGEPADRCRDRNARLRGPLWRLLRVVCEGPQRRLRRATKLPLSRDQVPGDDSRRSY